MTFADALMVRPVDLDDETVTALRRVYSHAELVELTLKVLKFNTQKINVALGTHTWITSDAIAALPSSQDGAFVASDRDQSRP